MVGKLVAKKSTKQLNFGAILLTNDLYGTSQK